MHPWARREAAIVAEEARAKGEVVVRAVRTEEAAEQWARLIALYLARCRRRRDAHPHFRTLQLRRVGQRQCQYQREHHHQRHRHGHQQQRLLLLDPSLQARWLLETHGQPFNHYGHRR